jgi:glucosyl-dolichyl phosphate glucuronosyltransferase
MFLSVIIPTYNRCALLKRTLMTIMSQRFSGEHFEVLVIDNHSTDSTKEVTESFHGEIRNLKYLFVDKPGLHEGRHAGMRMSAGDILVYADDDIKAFPEWLESIADSFQDASVALVGGKNIPDYEVTPPAWIENLWIETADGRYMAEFSLLDFGDTIKQIHPHFVFGCNFSIRKSVVNKIGGFHPDALPQSLLKFRGDGETHVSDQVLSLGYKTIYNPNASVQHFVPASRMNIDYLKKRSYAEGITRSYRDIRKMGFVDERLFTTLKHETKKLLNLMRENKIGRAVCRSFYNGYYFHQQEVKRDEALLAWVMKENNLD